MRRPRSRGIIQLVALFILVALGWRAPDSFGTTAPTTQSNLPRLDIDFRDGLLSVDAAGVPLARVLGELSARAGIAIRAPLQPDGTITASFRGHPLPDGLRRLLGSAVHFVIVYEPGDSGSGVPAEVWVWGAAAARPAPTTSRPTAQGAEEWTAPLAPDWPERFPAPEGSGLSAASATALGDPDPAVRREAVEVLGARGDEGVDTLHLLLGTDPDPHVRAAAARALLRIGSPRALTVVRPILGDQEMADRLPYAPGLSDGPRHGKQ